MIKKTFPCQNTVIFIRNLAVSEIFYEGPKNKNEQSLRVHTIHISKGLHEHHLHKKFVLQLGAIFVVEPVYSPKSMILIIIRVKKCNGHTYSNYFKTFKWGRLIYQQLILK